MSIQSPTPARPQRSTPPAFLKDPAQAGRLDSSTAGLFLLLLYTFYVFNLLQQPGNDWLDLSTTAQSMIIGGFVAMVGIWRYLVSAADSWVNMEVGRGGRRQQAEMAEMTADEQEELSPAQREEG